MTRANLHAGQTVKPKLVSHRPILFVMYVTTAAAMAAVVWIVLHFTMGVPLPIFPVLVGVVMLFHASTGISAGYHRMLTHGAAPAHPLVEAYWLIAGSMAFQMRPNDWATVHFKHHRVTDKPGDPHSPVVEDIPFAHMLWLVYPRERLPVDRKFADNRVSTWVGRYFLLWVALGLLIPTAVGYVYGGWSAAWQCFFWAGPVRIFVHHHITWSVNSFGHSWGYRNFETDDNSRNNPIVALFTAEGWHNNHHGIAGTANQAMRWWEWPFDITAWGVFYPLQLLGLAKPKWVYPAQIKERQQQLLRQRALRLEAS